MTVRLRDPAQIKQNYFACLPDELTPKILISVQSEQSVGSYLSNIMCVCKVWNSLFHDIAIELINANKLPLTHLPFIRKMKATSAFYIYKYLQFLQGDVSLEELNRYLGNIYSLEDITFRKRTLTSLDLSTLVDFRLEQLERLKPLFSKIENLSRPIYSTFQDNMILPSFSGVKKLHFAPNSFTDLSFKKMPLLDTLSLSFGHPEIVANTIEALSQCTTISSLHLLANSPSERFSFPASFRLPPQVTELTLNNFIFELDIFSKCTQINRLHIMHTEVPPSFKTFENLKYLSIKYIPHARVLTLKDLKVNELVIDSLNLHKLNLDKVTYQSLSLSSLRLCEIHVVHSPL